MNNLKFKSPVSQHFTRSKGLRIFSFHYEKCKMQKLKLKLSSKGMSIFLTLQ